MWKTDKNTNVYLTETPDNAVPENPEFQPLRRVSSSLEGSYEIIENDTVLPGRNPSKNRRGTDSNAGDLVVNFAPLEHDKLFEAVLCSEKGFVKNETLSNGEHDVYEMVPGNKQRYFALLKYFTQDPKLYQLFRGLQFNTLGISFEIGSLVKLTFGLMGVNNPQLEDKEQFAESAPGITDNDGNIANALPTFTTEEFITLVGSWKFKSADDAEPVEYIDGVSISLEFNNNMANLPGLFQVEAIDKSLDKLDITGIINQYLKGGKIYNIAKQGEGGELHITVRSEKDDAEYEFIFKISFDNSTLSGDAQLQQALPFSTYGEDRFVLRKKVPAGTGSNPISVTSVYLNKNTLALAAGGTERLTATVLPADASNKAIEWESDDSEVAAVDPSGNVTAVAEGIATITATSNDSSTGIHQDSCEVTVAAASAV